MFSVWTACPPGDLNLLEVKWRPRSETEPGIEPLIPNWQATAPGPGSGLHASLKQALYQESVILE